MSIEQNEEQEISSEEKSYFAMIPHMADDDSPIYQQCLYSHYRRGKGNVTENATASREPLRRKSASASSTVVEARRELKERKPPYIKLHRRRAQRGTRGRHTHGHLACQYGEI